jgi:hypothetical protein
MIDGKGLPTTSNEDQMTERLPWEPEPCDPIEVWDRVPNDGIATREEGLEHIGTFIADMLRGWVKAQGGRRCTNS